MIEYEVRENDGEFEVVNKETDEVVDVFGDKEDADRFVRLLKDMQKECDDID
jgi:hypothetical protein